MSKKKKKERKEKSFAMNGVALAVSSLWKTVVLEGHSCLLSPFFYAKLVVYSDSEENT